MPQKELPLLRNAWNMPVLFSIYFYQTHIGMTNDCVSITKTLVKRVKLMADRYKENTHIKSKGKCKDKEVSQKKVHTFSCKTMIVKHLTLY